MYNLFKSGISEDLISEANSQDINYMNCILDESYYNSSKLNWYKLEQCFLSSKNILSYYSGLENLDDIMRKEGSDDVSVFLFSNYLRNY